MRNHATAETPSELGQVGRTRPNGRCVRRLRSSTGSGTLTFHRRYVRGIRGVPSALPNDDHDSAVSDFLCAYSAKRSNGLGSTLCAASHQTPTASYLASTRS